MKHYGNWLLTKTQRNLFSLLLFYLVSFVYYRLIDYYYQRKVEMVRVDSICTKKHKMHKMHKMHKHPWFWKFYLHKEVSTTQHSKILFAQRENYFCIGWKFYLHKEKFKNSICTKRLLVTIWAILARFYLHKQLVLLHKEKIIFV